MKEFFSGGWGCLGYAPGVCWSSVRKPYFKTSNENKDALSEAKTLHYDTAFFWKSSLDIIITG